MPARNDAEAGVGQLVLRFIARATMINPNTIRAPMTATPTRTGKASAADTAPRGLGSTCCRSADCGRWTSATGRFDQCPDLGACRGVETRSRAGAPPAPTAGSAAGSRAAAPSSVGRRVRLAAPTKVCPASSV